MDSASTQSQFAAVLKRSLEQATAVAMNQLMLPNMAGSQQISTPFYHIDQAIETRLEEIERKVAIVHEVERKVELVRARLLELERQVGILHEARDFRNRKQQYSREDHQSPLIRPQLGGHSHSQKKFNCRKYKGYNKRS